MLISTAHEGFGACTHLSSCLVQNRGRKKIKTNRWGKQDRDRRTVLLWCCIDDEWILHSKLDLQICVISSSTCTLLHHRHGSNLAIWAELGSYSNQMPSERKRELVALARGCRQHRGPVKVLVCSLRAHLLCSCCFWHVAMHSAAGVSSSTVLSRE